MYHSLESFEAQSPRKTSESPAAGGACPTCLLLRMAHPCTLWLPPHHRRMAPLSPFPSCDMSPMTLGCLFTVPCHNTTATQSCLEDSVFSLSKPIDMALTGSVRVKIVISTSRCQEWKFFCCLFCCILEDQGFQEINSSLKILP